jgi:hypothetical protein
VEHDEVVGEDGDGGAGPTEDWMRKMVVGGDAAGDGRRSGVAVRRSGKKAQVEKMVTAVVVIGGGDRNEEVAEEEVGGGKGWCRRR